LILIRRQYVEVKVRVWYSGHRSRVRACGASPCQDSSLTHCASTSRRTSSLSPRRWSSRPRAVLPRPPPHGQERKEPKKPNSEDDDEGMAGDPAHGPL